MVFKIIEGQFTNTGTHLEVLMDDMLYPAYSTGKIKSANNTFNEIGDAMVRELDLSRMTLRLVTEQDKKGEDDEDDVKAKITGQTLDTLKRCLYTPTQVSLGGNKVTVSMRYIPVKMELDASESFNNAGNLRVEILDAANLPAADRNGYSDPYCIFRLNDKEVHKTKTIKKTLHPAWNEFFETPIRSRTAGGLKVDMYDWDFADKADHLGASAIDLNQLEPFQAKEVTLNLDGKSGTVRLKMLFKPDYVVRSRQGTGTFSGSFNQTGKIIGAPVKAGTFMGGAIGGGLAKGGSFLARGFKRSSPNQHAASPSQVSALDGPSGGVAEMRDTSMESSGPNGHVASNSVASTNRPASPSTPMHKRTTSYGQVSESPADSGTASIAVLSASGFPSDTKLQVRILHDGSKGLSEVLKTDAVKSTSSEVTYKEDSKKVSSNASDAFRAIVRHSHTFGSDQDLGEATFYINDQSAGGTQEVKVGEGTVVIKSSFQPMDTSSLQPPSSLHADSPSSKSKSLGRFMSRKERSVTPSG